MSARSVQISLDEALLARVDKRRHARREGRSAFIRRALEIYLDLERRREIDQAYARGYGAADDNEFAALLDSQQWPDE